VLIYHEYFLNVFYIRILVKNESELPRQNTEKQEIPKQLEWPNRKKKETHSKEN